MEIEIIDGELVDTYGGDFTYKYVYASEEDGEVTFYEYYVGAKAEPESIVYDSEDLAEYKELYKEIVKDAVEDNS